MTDLTRADLEARDLADPLRAYRSFFELREGLIYLDGNSLGVLPHGVAERVADVVCREWGCDLITSWNKNDWMGLAPRIGAKLARLIGAAPGEVIAADSTSINIFKLLTAALKLRPSRRVILSEKGNFPTDLYMAQGLIDLLGGTYELRLVEDGADLSGALDQDVAVVMLTQVDYRTGRMLDMAATTQAAHQTGALVLWDLAHSAGAFPVDLNGSDADFAVGCGYKYLNGGPGAAAFLYVAERLQDAINPALSGWLGHEAPFAFDGDYRPAPGIARHLVGTPPVLSFAAFDQALSVFDTVDMGLVREKSKALSDLFIQLVESRCAGHGLTLASPRDAAQRGSQVSFGSDNGYPIMQALIAQDVIGDFRAPNLMRFGFTPLYIGYADIWDAVERLRIILETCAWDTEAFKQRSAVT
ncbi:MAG: kynureninase [Alphaproteobacteria bacterium]|nr:kynureninase [Alphaproteobacteria bacterium]